MPWGRGGGGVGGRPRRHLLYIYMLCMRNPTHASRCVMAAQGLPLHALAAYEDGSAALWDCRAPAVPLASARLHDETALCIAVTPDCRGGFSGGADATLAAFDLCVPEGSLTLGQRLELPAPGVADVALRSDGRIAASAGWDGKLRVWHARRRRPLALLRWHGAQAACAAFSADCELLAGGGRDNHISVWGVYQPSGGGGGSSV